MEAVLLVFVFILIATLVGVSVSYLPILLLGIQVMVSLALGALIYFLIREKKQTQKLVNKKDQEISAVIDNITDGIIVYDETFTVLHINTSALELFKLSEKDITRKQVRPDMTKDPSLKLLTQVMFPSLAPAMNQITTEGWPQITELAFNDPILKLRVTLARLVNTSQGVTGFMKIIHDETREKSILESKSEFITVAAHQLRTPLTALKWTLEHIINNTNDESLKTIANEGHEVSERTLKIVNDLLDASKIEEGRFGFNPQNVDVRTFLTEIINQLQPVAKEFGITLNLEPNETPLTLYADPEKLGMAIFNLIDNAIRYNSEHGSVTISYSLTSDSKQAHIRIRDTGVGIPTQEISKLFTKFYRGTNVIQLQPNGSGLGLYITKNIIEANGGKIGVESVLKRGTTFHITLPTSRNNALGVTS